MIPAPSPLSIPDVVSVHDYGAPDTAPTLLLEAPHGATLRTHFDTMREALRGDYPGDLEDFFFVNTDVGSFELADRIANLWAEASPSRAARVVRSLIPRTFIDCNRVIAAGPTEGSAGATAAVTPGIHSYVRNKADRDWLIERHQAYIRVAESSYETVCSQPDGRALMVHSFAPRSLQIETDENVVQALHREYQPDRIETWPLRAEIDLIVDTPEGERLADSRMTERLCLEGERAGYEIALCRTYTLHEGTYARVFAQRYPQQTLCAEFRRDLLVPQFTPFDEMPGDAAKVDRAANAVVSALKM